MGSFVGHIDEAIFFLLLALWWMWNLFSRHIRCQWEKREFTSQVSFPLPNSRRIPLESILKVAFPLAGLVGEIVSQGPAMLDEEGHFRKVNQMQHMSIYGIFILHGIIDIMMSYGVPLPKGLDYASAVACFAWYGLSFSFHAHMHGKGELEMMVHMLPVYVMYAFVVIGVLEMFNPHAFILCMSRIYCLLVLGTWFFHVAFILFIPYPWPGSDPNPAWDQSDERNTHAIVAIFGFHLLGHVFTVTFVYMLVYIYLRVVKREGKKQFKPLLDKSDENIEI